MTTIASLNDLLIDELQDLYSAENQLVKALPKMAKAASHPPLKQGFRKHLVQTRGHVARLTRALKLLGTKPKAKVCHAMKGLVQEGGEAIGMKGPAAVRDANLIGAAQRVEHYEIAAYGCARAFAQKLAREDVASLLQLTLDEEGDTNKKLTDLASDVNDAAFTVTFGREVTMPATASQLVL
jgi:ferritin-like metal-binding protein YciE